MEEGTRPFRFGVQERRAKTGAEWRARARTIEALGYEALYVPDHFDDQLAPFAAVMAAADATTTLRVGTLVLDNDYRHPVVVAKEAATIDVLSDGRLHLGIGAGWLVDDYERSGINYDAAGTRIERLEEGIEVLKGFFTGRPFSFAGRHYVVRDIEGYPAPVQRPHPPFLLGGGGRRMLSLAAREADILHVNYDLREGKINPTLVKTGLAAATDEKLRWVKDAAGDRFSKLELAITVFFANVTDDRQSLAGSMARGLQCEPRDVLDMPHFLLGSVDEIVETLVERRERFGFSFVVVPGSAAEALQPVVEQLTGR